jgi:hypothetical protein
MPSWRDASGIFRLTSGASGTAPLAPKADRLLPRPTRVEPAPVEGELARAKNRWRFTGMGSAWIARRPPRSPV